MKCFFTVYTPLSRARAHAHIREFALFAFTTFTEILAIGSNWVGYSTFSQFLRAESFFVWRASLVYLLKYVWNICVFICLSEGYKEICEGCESKKSKIAVRTRVRAREEGVCVESLMIWRECFRAKTKTPPPEVEELDRIRVDGSDVMIYLPSIARRIWRESSA